MVSIYPFLMANIIQGLSPRGFARGKILCDIFLHRKYYRLRDRLFCFSHIIVCIYLQKHIQKIGIIIVKFVNIVFKTCKQN